MTKKKKGRTAPTPNKRNPPMPHHNAAHTLPFCQLATAILKRMPPATSSIMDRNALIRRLGLCSEICTSSFLESSLAFLSLLLLGGKPFTRESSIGFQAVCHVPAGWGPSPPSAAMSFAYFNVLPTYPRKALVNRPASLSLRSLNRNACSSRYRNK